MFGGLAIGLRSCAGGWRMTCLMLGSSWCFQLADIPSRDLYGSTILSRCRKIQTLLLSRCCLAAQLLRLTRRLEVGLDMLYAILLRITIGE